jgi:MGT family glycosyltransferase
MATIALINIDMHGHVNPTLGLVAELTRAGHKVHFYSAEEFRQTVLPTGGVFHPYPTTIGKAIAETAQMQAIADTSGEAAPKELAPLKRGLDEFNATFDSLYQAMAELRPDLMIVDFVSLAARIIAENLNIPQIKFFTTYASNEHYDLMAASFAKREPMTIEALTAAQHTVDEKCKTCGLRSLNLAKSMRDIATHNLVFLPRALQPFGDTFDERFNFVGPCFLPTPASDANSLIPAGDGPVLVVSLGSLFHEWPEFYRSVIEAFGGTDWRVVMSIGRHLKAADLGPLPPNIAVFPHIPQVALLQHADLFVSHGGMNSTMEALTYEVPLVVIPQIEEQMITARNVTEMGLGLKLERPTLTTNLLAEAVAHVHNSQAIAAKVASMAQAIKEAGGPKAVLTLVDRIVEVEGGTAFVVSQETSSESKVTSTTNSMGR